MGKHAAGTHGRRTRAGGLPLAVAAGLLLALAIQGPSRASTTIDVTDQEDGLGGQFGTPIPTIGQTVTVPAGETTLSSFAVEMEVPSARIFRGEVYAWDGTHDRATGSALWESAPQQTSGSGHQEVAFEPGVAVTAGQQYVLFVTISRDWESNSFDNSGYLGIVRNGAYAGGTEVYLTDGGDEGEWTTTAWSPLLSDLAFRAQFAEPEVTGLDPSISGVAQVGHTLSAHPGPVDPADAALAYVWKANGSPIAGATGATYVVRAGQVGKHLSVTITATKSGYTSQTETSPATAVVHGFFANPQVGAAPGRVPQGGTFEVSAVGLTPGNTYTITIGRGTVLGTATADVYGELDIAVHLPSNTPVGTQVLTVTGSSPHTVNTISIGITRG